MQNEAINAKLRKLLRLCLDRASTPEEAAVALARAKAIAAKYDIPLDWVLSEPLPNCEVRFTASTDSTEDIEAFAAYASSFEQVMLLTAELGERVASLLNEATASPALFYAEFWQQHLHGTADIMADIPGTVHMLQPPSAFHGFHTTLVRYALLFSSRADLLRDVVRHLRVFEMGRAQHAMQQVTHLSSQLHSIVSSLSREISAVV